VGGEDRQERIDSPSGRNVRRRGVRGRRSRASTWARRPTNAGPPRPRARPRGAPVLAPDAKLPVVALLPALVHGESASVAQRAPRDETKTRAPCSVVQRRGPTRGPSAIGAAGEKLLIGPSGKATGGVSAAAPLETGALFFFRFQFQPTFDSSLARIAELAPALSDLGAIRSAASLPRWREEKYHGASRGPDAHSPARKTHVSPARQAPRSPRPPRTALTAPRPHRAPNAPPPRRRTRPREKRKRCWP